MIQLTQHEADYLIANVPTRNLKKASERKFYGGKTYYAMNDDDDSLNVVAMLRGYVPITRLKISKNGKTEEVTVSPKDQLLEDDDN